MHPDDASAARLLSKRMFFAVPISSIRTPSVGIPRIHQPIFVRTDQSVPARIAPSGFTRLAVTAAASVFISMLSSTDVAAQKTIDLHEPSAGDIEVVKLPGTNASIEMVYVPGGTFTVGSAQDSFGHEADEGPPRTVSVPPFWMSRYEITYDQYAPFRFREQDSDSTSAETAFDADGIARPSPPYEDPAHGLGNQGFPAAGMTQWGALQFAKWVSDKTGGFYRLPTEFEWEFACRAGSGDPYPFGDEVADLGTYAWYATNSGERYHEVGTREPNAFGLYDMLGNVSEWTMDQYDANYYASLEEGADSPWATPTSLHPRTVRGGAYDDEPEALRCANRIRSSLSWKRRDPQIPKSFWWNTDSQFVGFRIIRPANPPSTAEQEEFWLENF